MYDATIFPYKMLTSYQPRVEKSDFLNLHFVPKLYKIIDFRIEIFEQPK